LEVVSSEADSAVLVGVYPVAATVARVDYCWRYEHATWQIFHLFLWLSYIHFFSIFPTFSV